MTKATLKRVYVDIPVSLHKRIRAIAKQENLRMKHVLERALIGVYGNHKKDKRR